MHDIRDLCCQCAKLYVETRKLLGNPFSQYLPKKKEIHIPTLKIEKFDPGNTGNLLLEIGTEEMPDGIIEETIKQLHQLTKTFLDKLSLSHENITVDATPRRLVIFVEKLTEGIKGSSSEIKGPPLSVIFDQKGDLSAQGIGFFKKQGFAITTLKEITTSSTPLYSKDNAYLYFNKITEDISTLEILHKELPQFLSTITFKKTMRWAQEPFTFSRPIRHIIALFDNKQIPFSIASVISGKTTYAHRQLKEHKKVAITTASTFYDQLRENQVIISVDERKKSIIRQLDAIEEKTKFKTIEREKVTHKVLFLTEAPHLEYISFDEKYLALPRELLVSLMIEHQKYFPMENSEGKINVNICCHPR